MDLLAYFSSMDLHGNTPFLQLLARSVAGAPQAQLRRQNDSAMRDMSLKVVAIRELRSERDDLKAQTEELQRQVRAPQQHCIQTKGLLRTQTSLPSSVWEGLRL
jgi:hypothetical protein